MCQMKSGMFSPTGQDWLPQVTTAHQLCTQICTHIQTPVNDQQIYPAASSGQQLARQDLLETRINKGPHVQ